MPAKSKKAGEANGSDALAEWLEHLASLVSTVRRWAVELDWSTREITKKMEDSQLGSYEVPALIMQKETARVLLDPIARYSPGADGVVDLYLMPAYDDIATLLFVRGKWQLRYLFDADRSHAAIMADESRLLSKKTLSDVLDEMTAHAAKAQ